MDIEIEKAREHGFCFGVRRAIKLVEKAHREYGEVVTLGPIVHNQQVVDRLARMGIEVVRDFSQMKGRAVAITAHGAPPELLDEIALSGSTVIDTTCPIVRSAQKAAKKLAEAGYKVIIFGEKDHPEVRGLLGWAGTNSVATLDSELIAHMELNRRAGILSQTTQNKNKFLDFIIQVYTDVLHDVRELRVVNTICDETEKRQDAALELARKSDIVLVVGGRNSANTKRLAEICSTLVETHLIERDIEIEADWLYDKKHVGVAAGTSTPDKSIDVV
ncbi:MAG: 4-hydroxy-3-methylbut-2-enyl diphosphate reductase, partial [Dehalococcoidia bacterium]